VDQTQLNRAAIKDIKVWAEKVLETTNLKVDPRKSQSQLLEPWHPGAIQRGLPGLEGKPLGQRIMTLKDWKAVDIICNHRTCEDCPARECGRCANQCFPVRRKLNNEEAKKLISAIMDSIVGSWQKLGVIALIGGGSYLSDAWKDLDQDGRRKMLQHKNPDRLDLHPESFGIFKMVRPTKVHAGKSWEPHKHYLDTWLMPWLDWQVLIEDPMALIRLIGIRARGRPSHYAHFDFDQTRLAREAGILDGLYSSQMVSLAMPYHYYGKVRPFDGWAIHTNEALGFAGAVYALTVQRRLLAFLATAGERILVLANNNKPSESIMPCYELAQEVIDHDKLEQALVDDLKVVTPDGWANPDGRLSGGWDLRDPSNFSEGVLPMARSRIRFWRTYKPQGFHELTEIPWETSRKFLRESLAKWPIRPKPLPNWEKNRFIDLMCSPEEAEKHRSDWTAIVMLLRRSRELHAILMGSLNAYANMNGKGGDWGNWDNTAWQHLRLGLLVANAELLRKVSTLLICEIDRLMIVLRFHNVPYDEAAAGSGDMAEYLGRERLLCLIDTLGFNYLSESTVDILTQLDAIMMAHPEPHKTLGFLPNSFYHLGEIRALAYILPQTGAVGYPGRVTSAGSAESTLKWAAEEREKLLERLAWCEEAEDLASHPPSEAGAQTSAPTPSECSELSEAQEARIAAFLEDLAREPTPVPREPTPVPRQPTSEDGEEGDEEESALMPTSEAAKEEEQDKGHVVKLDGQLFEQMLRSQERRIQRLRAKEREEAAAALALKAKEKEREEAEKALALRAKEKEKEEAEEASALKAKGKETELWEEPTLLEPPTYPTDEEDNTPATLVGEVEEEEEEEVVNDGLGLCYLPRKYYDVMEQIFAAHEDPQAAKVYHSFDDIIKTLTACGFQFEPTGGSRLKVTVPGFWGGRTCTIHSEHGRGKEVKVGERMKNIRVTLLNVIPGLNFYRHIKLDTLKPASPAVFPAKGGATVSGTSSPLVSSPATATAGKKGKKGKGKSR